MAGSNDFRRNLIVLLAAVGLLYAAGPANADFVFGPLENLGAPVNSPYIEYGTWISPDGLSHYFTSDRPGGSGGRDLWVTTRPTLSDPWGQPVNLGPTVNSSAWDSCPNISPNGLSLFFESERPGGVGGNDIWVTTRPTPDGDWGPPVNLGPTINTSAWDSCPAMSADGLTLYLTSDRPGGSGSGDLWVATRPTVSDPWGTPVNLGPTVNSSAWDGHPGISADGLLLFFHSNRSGGSGGEDIWMATRTSISDPWGQPVNLGPTVNSSTDDIAPDTSPDDRRLFFGSGRPGGAGAVDIWQTPILPIVDFNGDGQVDGKEVLALAECWGTDDSVCDVGPMAWGDGAVDVEDLKVLAGSIGEEVNDPTLVAHWALDETEGIIASDSAGTNDGTVMGAPAWQPDGGKIGGALEFDGTIFVVADHVLSPSDGAFSVLAWIKGGAAGQAMISQQNGADWLMADAATGALMTELQSGSRFSGPLSSEAVITDGEWHRVGFTWDGTDRRLYADDVLVAEEADDPLAGSEGGLSIGCGKGMASDTFWQGLIDDVRIYNRAVRP